MAKFVTDASGATWWPNLEPMQVAFIVLAGEITQVKEAIPWVRCTSGNVYLICSKRNDLNILFRVVWEWEREMMRKDLGSKQSQIQQNSRHKHSRNKNNHLGSFLRKRVKKPSGACTNIWSKTILWIFCSFFNPLPPPLLLIWLISLLWVSSLFTYGYFPFSGNISIP